MFKLQHSFVLQFISLEKNKNKYITNKTVAIVSADGTVLPNLPVDLLFSLAVLKSSKSTPVSKVQVQPNMVGFMLLLLYEKLQKQMKKPVKDSFVILKLSK